MKKPSRGDGMAFGELLYGDNNSNLATSTLTSKIEPLCPGPNQAARSVIKLCRFYSDLECITQTFKRVFEDKSYK